MTPPAARLSTRTGIRNSGYAWSSVSSVTISSRCPVGASADSFTVTACPFPVSRGAISALRCWLDVAALTTVSGFARVSSTVSTCDAVAGRRESDLRRVDRDLSRERGRDLEQQLADLRRNAGRLDFVLRPRSASGLARRAE